MDVRSIRRAHVRGAVARLALKLSVLIAIASWLFHPQADVWKHAGQGFAAAGSWFRTTTIAALGGGTRTQPDTISAELDGLKAVKGFPASEIRCLALAIYFESGRETRDAQVGIGQIAMSRATAAKAPRALCRTVYLGMNQPGGCHFEATCQNIGNVPRSGPALTNAIDVATDLVSGTAPATNVATATHFHQGKSKPAWTRTMFKVASIGRIDFYAPDQPAEQSAPSAPPLTSAEPPRQPVASRKSLNPSNKTSATTPRDANALSKQVFGLD